RSDVQYLVYTQNSQISQLQSLLAEVRPTDQVYLGFVYHYRAGVRIPFYPDQILSSAQKTDLNPGLSSILDQFLQELAERSNLTVDIITCNSSGHPKYHLYFPKKITVRYSLN